MRTYRRGTVADPNAEPAICGARREDNMASVPHSGEEDTRVAPSANGNGPGPIGAMTFPEDLPSYSGPRVRCPAGMRAPLAVPLRRDGRRCAF